MSETFTDRLDEIEALISANEARRDVLMEEMATEICKSKTADEYIEAGKKTKLIRDEMNALVDDFYKLMAERKLIEGDE